MGSLRYGSSVTPIETNYGIPLTAEDAFTHNPILQLCMWSNYESVMIPLPGSYYVLPAELLDPPMILYN